MAGVDPTLSKITVFEADEGNDVRLTIYWARD